MVPSMECEKLVAHYSQVYKGGYSFRIQDWIALMKMALKKDDVLLLNPFDPSQSEYYKLLAWMPLADMDELLFGDALVESASCMAWWLCFSPWEEHKHLKENRDWKRAFIKSYLNADFKSLKINPSKLLDLIENQNCFSKAVITRMSDYREENINKEAKSDSIMLRLHKWNTQRKMNKRLDKVVLMGSRFKPRCLDNKENQA